MDLAEARQLYHEAEKAWEFHDSTPAFRRFADWCEEHFEELLAQCPDCPGRKSLMCCQKPSDQPPSTKKAGNPE